MHSVTCPFISLLLFLSALGTSTSAAAQVLINEAASRNHLLRDADGDTPDWIELTATEGAVDLTGWSLTDDRAEPTKWTFPGGLLAPGDFKLIWASGKDRPAAVGYRTLVDPSAGYRYLLSMATEDFDWREPDYDDAEWLSGTGSIGYGSEDDETLLPDGTRSVLLRQVFEVADPTAVQELMLQIDADDGFAAYLNGRRIAFRNLNVSPPPAPVAVANLPESGRLATGRELERYSLTDVAELLLPGRNVLSLQAHRAAGADGTGLTLKGYLSARYATPATEGATPPGPLNLATAASHTNFRLSSGGETVYLFDPMGSLVDSLELPELDGGISYGRTYDDRQLTLFDEPTPGAANTGRRLLGLVQDEVRFSRVAGPAEPFTLTLNCGGCRGNIRYTLDGSPPQFSSPIYNAPLLVDSTTVVRARVFVTGNRPGPVTTRSYLIDTQHEIAVVSLATDPANFFDPAVGIYVLGEGYEGDLPYFHSNIWDGREVPVSAEFYLPDGGVFAQDLGAKIFGNFNRSRDQRSLALAARGRYGKSTINYPLFPNRPVEEHKDLVLRNSGSDWLQTHLLDLTLTGLVDGSGLDVQAGRPVATYLNGAYWGIYNLREKINADWLSRRHGLPKEEIDLIESNGEVQNGDGAAHAELMAYVAANDLSDPMNYEWVAERVDLDNFLFYYAVQVYWDNRDWPGNNMRMWRPRRPGGKWRWILYDTDNSSGMHDWSSVDSRSLDYLLVDTQTHFFNPPWATLLFRRLMEHPDFQTRFINQLADVTNAWLSPETATAAIERNADAIAGEIPRAFTRYGSDPNWWPASMAKFTSFFEGRPPVVKAFVKERFGLPAYHAVTVEITDTTEGYVQLNTLELRETTWTGDYYEGVSIPLKAVAKPGYEFLHWEGSNQSILDSLSVGLSGPVSYRPVFGPCCLNQPLKGLKRISQFVVTPNPLRARGQVRLRTLEQGRVVVTLLDAYGREVRTVVDREFAAGRHYFPVMLGGLATGVYLLRVTEGGAGQTMVRLVKH